MGGEGDTVKHSHSRTREEEILEIRARQKINYGHQSVFWEQIKRAAPKRSKSLALDNVTEDQPCLAMKSATDKVVRHPWSALLQTFDANSGDSSLFLIIDGSLKNFHLRKVSHTTTGQRIMGGGGAEGCRNFMGLFYE
jgi:hypothetical protein